MRPDHRRAQRVPVEPLEDIGSCLPVRAGGARSPVARALRFIEGHLDEDLCLDDIAGAGGVSRFQLCRSFVATVGVPVMQYVRSRRLSEAARALAAGAPEIWIPLT